MSDGLVERKPIYRCLVCFVQVATQGFGVRVMPESFRCCRRNDSLRRRVVSDRFISLHAAAMKSRTLDAVNNQIQAEFQSAYIYLAMSARFEDMKMSGAANWMRIQWQEETAHAMKLYDHLIRRGESPVLQTIDKPEVSFESALDAFERVLEHERHVTHLIHSLYEVAVEEKDYALQTLLHWFIDEQVEEEENAEAIIDSLRLAGESGQGLFLVDRELGQRAPEEEEDE